MSPPNTPCTSTASAGFASASEGSTAGTLEASSGVQTERSYVGSQDAVGDQKHLIQKWCELVLSINQCNLEGAHLETRQCFASRAAESKYCLFWWRQYVQKWNEFFWVKNPRVAKTSWSLSLFFSNYIQTLSFQVNWMSIEDVHHCDCDPNNARDDLVGLRNAPKTNHWSEWSHVLWKNWTCQFNPNHVWFFHDNCWM